MSLLDDAAIAANVAGFSFKKPKTDSGLSNTLAAPLPAALIFSLNVPAGDSLMSVTLGTGAICVCGT